MDKSEFIEKLRVALSGEIGYNAINENIRYYEDYIEMEMKKGMAEWEVLDTLGDPRLIAKTIVETSKASGNTAGGEAFYTQQQEGAGEEKDFQGEGFQGRSFKVPGWVWGLAVLLVIIFLFSMLTSFIAAFLPIIAPIIMIVLIVKIVQYFMR